MSSEFASLYSPLGRPSIPPEKLLRGALLQAFRGRGPQPNGSPLGAKSGLRGLHLAWICLRIRACRSPKLKHAGARRRFVQEVASKLLSRQPSPIVAPEGGLRSLDRSGSRTSADRKRA